jgi:hypothetical protein
MVSVTRTLREAKPGRGHRFDRTWINAFIGIALISGCLATMFYVFTRPSRTGIGPEHAS